MKITVLTGTWWAVCDCCGATYKDGCGSTPCCGSTSHVIDHVYDQKEHDEAQKKLAEDLKRK